MKLEVGSWTFEVTRTHAYFKACGWEGLWDFSGTVGSSLNRTA